jgi:hypothetical protein
MMVMSDNGDATTWQTVDEAARRLGRNKGHVRKLCRRWAAEGKAQRVSGGGRRSSWRVRSDAGTVAPVVPKRSPPLVITLGDTRIVLELPCTVSITPPRPADRRAREAIDGRSDGH